MLLRGTDLPTSELVEAVVAGRAERKAVVSTHTAARAAAAFFP